MKQLTVTVKLEGKALLVAVAVPTTWSCRR